MAAFLAEGCRSNAGSATPLADAEQAYAAGSYAEAQKLCDGIATGPDTTRLTVEQRCRLSLLLLRLAENYGNEEANTALAARSLEVATDRSADSVALFVNSLPVEDRAGISLLSAISEAHNATEISDTILHYE